jgi:D-amino-acid dehydrogenase
MNQSGREPIIVVGAGIVGVCTAWHLLRRGAEVTLIDRDEPGRGCSFGNAGAVSFGSVAPLAMPGVMRDAVKMLLDPAAPLRIPLGIVAHTIHTRGPARRGEAHRPSALDLARERDGKTR